MGRVKLLHVIGILLYAAIPFGVMIWSAVTDRVVGLESFFQILFRVTISYAAAIILCANGTQKLIGIDKYKLIQIYWMRAALQYVLYTIAFFIILFVIEISMVGSAASGDDYIYPFMHR